MGVGLSLIPWALPLPWQATTKGSPLFISRTHTRHRGCLLAPAPRGCPSPCGDEWLCGSARTCYADQGSPFGVTLSSPPGEIPLFQDPVGTAAAVARQGVECRSMHGHTFVQNRPLDSDEQSELGRTLTPPPPPNKNTHATTTLALQIPRSGPHGWSCRHIYPSLLPPPPPPPRTHPTSTKHLTKACASLGCPAGAG